VFSWGTTGRIGPEALCYRRIRRLGSLPRGLCLDEVEAFFDAMDAVINSVEACGDVGVLLLEQPETALDLDNVIAELVQLSPDGTEMLQNKVVARHRGASIIVALSKASTTGLTPQSPPSPARHGTVRPRLLP